MRVLLISNIYPPGFIGGYELAAQDVAGMLHDRGHSVVVLTSADLNGAPGPDQPYPVIRSLEFVGVQGQPLRPRDACIRGFYVNLGNLEALRGTLVATRPDIVLCFNLVGLGVLGILRLLEATGIARIAVVMDDWFAGAAQFPVELASFRSNFGFGDDPFCGARVVACSRGILSEIGHGTGGPAGPLLIPAWVELERLAPDAMTCGPQARFVFASRIAPHKGIGIVVEAASMLRARGETGFTVDVFGAGLVAAAMQHAYACDVEELVRYKGALTKAEMLRLYHGYDALLFPTWEREPSGFVASEAAASGCVPIMTATMGGAEYFLDTHDCLKIGRTPEALAAAMLKIMGMAPPERLAWRSRVRRSARRMFGALRWYDRLEAFMVASHAERDGPVHSPDGVYQATAVLTHLWSHVLD